MRIHRIKLPKKEDPRGWLVENMDHSIMESVKHFLISTSKPGVVRGQHYHKRKREWFIVIQGKARIVFKDVTSGETEEINVSGEEIEMVEMVPMIAHAIENIGSEQLYLIALVNEPLDQNNTDTYSYTVI